MLVRVYSETAEGGAQHVSLCKESWRTLLRNSGSFRALLYGGMKESQPQAEVCLEETRAEAFSMLLHYLYTGRASLSSAREEMLLDFLGLAHRYGLQPLEDSTSEFLRTILNTNNVCLVFDVASLYSLSVLSVACCAYMDRHAPEVLNSDGFLLLSKVGFVIRIWFVLTLEESFILHTYYSGMS